MEYIQQADWFSPELDHSPTVKGYFSPNYDYYRPVTPAYSNPIRKGAMYSGVHKDVHSMSGAEMSAMQQMGAIAKMNGLNGFSVSQIGQNLTILGMPSYFVGAGLVGMLAGFTVLSKKKGKKAKQLKMGTLVASGLSVAYGLYSAGVTEE